MPATHAYGSNSTHTSSTANPITVSFTSYGDSVLVLMLTIAGTTLRTGGSPTYAGKLMEQAGSTQQAASSPETSVELWYLENPPYGASTVSLPNAGSLTIWPIVASGRSTTGSSAFDVAGGGNGTSTNPTASVDTTEPGCIIFAAVGSGAQTWAPSARSGTQIFDTDNGTYGDGEQYLLQANAGTQAMGWTFATSEDWAVVVAAFKPTKGPMRVNNYQFVKVGDGMSCAEKIR
jgi:hypothetical protein